MSVDARDILGMPSQTLFAVYTNGELKGAWRMPHSELRRLGASPAYRAVYGALAEGIEVQGQARLQEIVCRAAGALLGQEWSLHGEALRWCSLVVATLQPEWSDLAACPPEFFDILLRVEEGGLTVALKGRRVQVATA